MAKLDLEDFVSEVRNHSCLYNLSDPGYKDTKLKEIKWTAIGTKFGFTGRVAQLKWKNVRDRYVRVKRLMETKMTNDPQGTPPTWWLFNILDDFLNHPAVYARKILPNGQCQNEVQGDTNAIMCLKNEPYTRSTASENDTQLIINDEIKSGHQDCRRDTESSNSITKLLGTMSSKLQKIESALSNSIDERDEITLYVLSLAPRLRRLSSNQKSRAKLKFEQVLFQLESENI
ncbi:hypothetical protein CHUAL_005591 [Chamberlinius hualienensis]